MYSTELHATDSLRMISDEDLDAVAGGFRIYRADGGGGSSGGGGGGHVVGSRPNGNDIIAGFLIAGEIIGVLALL
jgi:hypothetical protein